MDWKKLFGIMFLGILLFGCVGQPPAVQNQTTNVSLTKVVKLGDTIQVDYTLRLENGTIIDTSNESVAKENGMYTPNRAYTPLTFQISPNSGLIDGFVNGVIGMQEGETKLIVVAPKDGYGEYDPTKVQTVPLYYNMSKFEEVPRSVLEAQDITIEKDKIINTNAGMISIYDFNNETVTLEYVLSPGQAVTYNGIPQEVENVTNDTIFIKFNVQVGDQYNTVSPSGVNTRVIVIQKNDTTFTADSNNPLAGETLYFTVTVRSIQ